MIRSELILRRVVTKPKLALMVFRLEGIILTSDTLYNVETDCIALPWFTHCTIMVKVPNGEVHHLVQRETCYT